MFPSFLTSLVANTTRIWTRVINWGRTISVPCSGTQAASHLLQVGLFRAIAAAIVVLNPGSWVTHCLNIATCNPRFQGAHCLNIAICNLMFWVAHCLNIATCNPYSKAPTA